MISHVFSPSKLSASITNNSFFSSVQPALLRLFAGLTYTAIFQLGVSIIPDTYLLSDGFSVCIIKYNDSSSHTPQTISVGGGYLLRGNIWVVLLILLCIRGCGYLWG